MALSTLPNEILLKVSSQLSVDDLKECLKVNHEWYHRFRSATFRNVHFKSKKQWRTFYRKISNDRTFGFYINGIALAKLGMAKEDFYQLPVYCPNLEYISFNPKLWCYFGSFSSHSNIKSWKKLRSVPSMQRLQITEPIIKTLGHQFTCLDLGIDLFDEWREVEKEKSILKLLRYTPNLHSLSLNNNSNPTLSSLASTANHPYVLSMNEFESIHSYCPQLSSLKLLGFRSYWQQNDSIISINATELLDLAVDMTIDSPDILCYFSKKYPRIRHLTLNLKLFEPRSNRMVIPPENSRMKAAFGFLANGFPHLKTLSTKFDEKYLPGDLFLQGLNLVEVTLESLTIYFSHFDYHLRGANNFRQLLSNSSRIITRLEIGNWDQSWNYELDILHPLRACPMLRHLSLSPQPVMQTEFHIDIILDTCPQLCSLEINNNYNLFVKNPIAIRKPHVIQKLKLDRCMVNDGLFDYLAQRCPKLSKLVLSRMTKPYDGNIALNINMPHHHFESIQMRGLQLGLRVQDAGFQCGYHATLCSLEETLKERSKRWYHLYSPTVKKSKTHKEHYPPPCLQRLSDSDAEEIQEINMTPQIWTEIAVVGGSRFSLEKRDNWKFDIRYGYLSVCCKSVDEFVFEEIAV
ncbi:hypothetical protein K501DRAFT_275512 [Backusella circina FSU 941]|nr:hypothetical protein K501DRAFT_275512 [Backusella circina FSU 941]